MNQITFIDFIKSLISETFTAVSETQYQQENKILELKKDLLASNSYLIEKYNLIEEAKIELGKEANKIEMNTYIDSKIESLKEILKTYFENGYVKTIIDGGKISAKFIYNIDSEESENLIIKADTPKTKKNKSSDKLENYSKMKINPNLIFKSHDSNINKISKRMTIQTFDLAKDKNIIDADKNLVSSIEIEFRTVIAE